MFLSDAIICHSFVSTLDQVLARVSPVPNHNINIYWCIMEKCGCKLNWNKVIRTHGDAFESVLSRMSSILISTQCVTLLHCAAYNNLSSHIFHSSCQGNPGGRFAWSEPDNYTSLPYPINSSKHICRLYQSWCLYDHTFQIQIRSGTHSRTEMLN